MLSAKLERAMHGLKKRANIPQAAQSKQVLQQRCKSKFDLLDESWLR
jgi:hypothetical protein